MNVLTNQELESIAVTAMYLMQGANTKYHFGLLEHCDGHLGLASDLARFAVAFTRFIDDNTDAATDWPGVLEYEVTEQLGAWLAVELCTRHAVTMEAFLAEARTRFDAFMQQDWIAYPLAVDGHFIEDLDLIQKLLGSTIYEYRMGSTGGFIRRLP